MRTQGINAPTLPESIHFNVGNIGVPTLGAPGVATPGAMSYFGQLRVTNDCRISVNHIHIIDDGAAPGALVMELWRWRSGALTQLATVTYTAPFGSDFVTIGVVPASPLDEVLAGDYLMAQAVTGTNLGGAWNGLTYDVHFRW